MATKGYTLQTSDGDVTNVSNVLATVTSIDLKTVAATNLYTVPSGKKLILENIIIAITATDTATVAATVSVGKTSNFNEFIGATVLTNLLNNGTYLSLQEAVGTGIMKVMSNGDVVALNVSVGATATTLTATAYVIGFLV